MLATAALQASDRSLTGIRTGNHSLQIENPAILEHGVSLRGDVSRGSFQPLVPESFRKQVFDIMYSFSYPGIKHSTELLSTTLLWAGMNYDINPGARPAFLVNS